MFVHALLTTFIALAPPSEVEAQALSDQLTASLEASDSVVAGQVLYSVVVLRNESNLPAHGCASRIQEAYIQVPRHVTRVMPRTDLISTCDIPFHLAPGATLEVPFVILVPEALGSLRTRTGLLLSAFVRVLVGVDRAQDKCLVIKLASSWPVLVP